jgi:hypothetical protein
MQRSALAPHCTSSVQGSQNARRLRQVRLDTSQYSLGAHWPSEVQPGTSLTHCPVKALQ